MPRVYVAFILDVKIVFNNIINNSRPPARMVFFCDQDGKQEIYNCWPNTHVRESRVRRGAACCFLLGLTTHYCES